MKRLAVFWMLMIGLCVGCAAPPVQPIVEGFSSQVVLDYDGTVYHGRFICVSPTQATLEFTSPKTVEGLTFAKNGDNTTVSYSGIELSVEEKSLPVGAAIELLCRVLGNSASATADASQTTQGTVGDIAYTLSFHPDSGYPKVLRIPSAALSVEFTDWKIIE